MKASQFLETILFLMLLSPTIVFPQARNAEFEVHHRGNLWETMKDDGTIGAPSPENRFEFFPSMDWPGGPEQLSSKDEQRSYMVGAGMWIGGKDNAGNVFFTENGPFTFVDQGTFETPAREENFLGSPAYDPNRAEEIIHAAWITSKNLRVERSSRAWGFRGLNNFIIMEYVVTNQNAAPLSDVYFGFAYLIRPSYQDLLAHNGWGDDQFRADELVRYDTLRSLLYAYDDTPNFDLPNDVGNYLDAADEMRTPGYAGFALLHADPAADERLQPATVLYAQLLNNEVLLSSATNTDENLYAILNGSDRSLQAQPDDRLTPFMLMACGPYNLAPSEPLRMVLVEAVNGIPIDEAVKGLEAQELLPAGLDSLQHTVDRAVKLFRNQYQLSAVSPPSPEIDIVPLPSSRQISVSWEPLEETWVNPISGRRNLREYRVYRSERSFIGPYEQVESIVPGEHFDRSYFFDQETGRWLFRDGEVQLSVSYFYAVTSVDSDGRESWFTNRNEEPVRAAGEPAADVLNVVVFPNPFREVSGFPTTGEENSIVWANLPSPSTIRVYTSSGELIKTLEHFDEETGEEVWDQLTESRQQVSPGIYFWTVSSKVGNATGTLLIIK